MDDEIRRRALRSAAKVAFGATLCWGVSVTGCGGKSVGGVDGATDDEISGSTGGSSPTEGTATGGSVAAGGSVAGGGASPGSDPGLACLPPLGPDDASTRSSWDPSIYACCTAYIASKGPPTLLASDPSGVNCCRYVSAAYPTLRAEFGIEAYPYETNLACCSLDVLPENEFIAPYCTPWGPPVPPALAAELEVAA